MAWQQKFPLNTNLKFEDEFYEIIKLTIFPLPINQKQPENRRDYQKCEFGLF